MLAVGLAAPCPLAAAENPPAVGEKAPDFALPALDGTVIRLSEELQRGPVVLVVLRGWPGYQCPFCVRQYGDFIRNRQPLEASGARVVWIYPAKADATVHAAEFVKGLEVPPNFRLAIDPDYTFTNIYDLRWEGEGETTYPSTFVIDKDGTIRWALISKTHGGRAAASDVLEALAKLDK
jgi:peroxiredoxin